MFRKLIPLAVLVVLVLGCKKKTPDTGAEGGSGAAGDPAPSGAAYTIKIREEHKGDKTRVVKTSNGTTTFTMDGKAQPMKEEEKSDYVEEVLEMPEGAAKPTKLVRTYKTAERANKGAPLKPLSYAGKTVTIEQTGGKYTAKVDGKPLVGAESDELLKEFDRDGKLKTEDFLPKKAVRVNEEWTADQEALKKFSGMMGIPIDLSKSSIAGKLTKVYTKDNKQWGVLVLRIELVPDPAAKGGSGSGKIGGEMTLETPIDGSSHEGNIKSKIKANVTFANNGKSAQMAIDAAEEETITPAK